MFKMKTFNYNDAIWPEPSAKDYIFKERLGKKTRKKIGN